MGQGRVEVQPLRFPELADPGAAGSGMAPS